MNWELGRGDGEKLKIGHHFFPACQVPIRMGVIFTSDVPKLRFSMISLISFSALFFSINSFMFMSFRVKLD